MKQNDKFRAGPPVNADADSTFQSGQEPQSTAGSEGLEDADVEEFKLQPIGGMWLPIVILIVASFVFSLPVTAYFSFGIGMMKGEGRPNWHGNSGSDPASVSDLFFVPWTVGAACVFAGILSMIPSELPPTLRLFAITTGICAMPGIIYGFNKLRADKTLAEGPYLVAYAPLMGVAVGLVIGCGLELLLRRIGKSKKDVQS